MRELWHTGWMHNRVRMIAASFLVKDLMIPWQEGAAWFWDTLVDADLANNTLGWQWTAGCGADAAPYFRVFNPTLQGEKFDPDGRYVGQWIPERKGLPSKMIHRPRGGEVSLLSGDFEQRGAYPSPVVDHGEARERALDAYAAMRGSFVRPEKD
jgi:deoxyribodipyrimidine photo-lyase